MTNDSNFSDPDKMQTLLAVVSSLPLFSELNSELQDRIAEEIEWFALPGGTTLFEAGDAADAIYFVITGCLGAFAGDQISGNQHLLGHIVAGEPVGEMALISGNPRNATVIALRDSELGRWSRLGFDTLMESHPRELLQITRLIVQRLENSQRLRGRPVHKAVKIFAVVPQNPGIDGIAFASQLVTCLQRFGRAALIQEVHGTEHTSDWFYHIERNNDFVVYLTDSQATAWTRLCLRQSDSVLLLAAAANPQPWPELAANDKSTGLELRAELVLLHSRNIEPHAARRWLNLTPGIPHHHICNMTDMARLTRLITGRGLGLVLSGGGARGFAHIGVMRALQEADIPVDTVGGTSIGAIIAGGIAAGWDYAEMVFHMKRSFVETNPLDDYTFPLISLVAGRKVSRLLRREFMDVHIEDLQLPYYCVSSNLTTGHSAVHCEGELWRWLRASVAIPGVLPPVFSEGEIFVDGATINNLPVDIMRQQGRGPVIGVDVGAQGVFAADSSEADGPPFWNFIRMVSGREKHINIFQVLLRAGMINGTNNTAMVRDNCDVLLQPTLGNVDLLNWKAFDEVVEAGYSHAMERLDSIHALLDR